MKNTEKKREGQSRFRQKLAGIPVFWQHFILLAVIMTLMAAALLLSSERYTEILSKNYLKQAENNFSQNCARLSASLNNTFTVQSVVEKSTGYENLRRIYSGTLPKTALTVSLSEVRGTFYDAMTPVRGAGAAESFLYFPNGNYACTERLTFENAEDCFKTAIYYEGLTPAEVLERLGESGFLSYIPETIVTTGGGTENCVTQIIHTTEASSVLGVVYPTRVLAENMGMNNLPDDAYLLLEDMKGNRLMTWGEEKSDSCAVFAHSLGTAGCRMTLGIPEAYFTSLVAPARQFGFIFFGATLLIGLILCFLLSDFFTQPLRRMLSAYANAEGQSGQKNEIRRLAEILATNRVQAEEVERVLSTGNLGRVFSGGVLSREEEKKLRQSCPLLDGSCRIAIVHSTAVSEDISQSDITELISDGLGEGFACTTVSGLESGILLPDDDAALNALAQVISDISDQLRVDGITALCGVSAPFVGVHNAYAAVRQARFSVPIRESSYLEVYSAEDSSGENRPGVFSWLTHERLYQAVIKNNREDTVEFIRALAADKYSAGDAKEVFYNVRFVVRSTANELQISLPEADALEYREEMRPKENFRRLEDLVCTLFDRLHIREQSSQNRTAESIVEYIRANYGSPSLSALAVSTHFSLPSKVIYAAVREQTGMNFNDFLVSVRMKEAARLLCTTQKSVDEISVECGYPAQSTFYRVFKKYYDESPNKYRTIH